MCLMKLENMSEFNFKSSPCTSIEQSERLLALGLKKETADMIHQPIGTTLFNVWDKQKIEDDFYPAWSLHRLIELMPEVIFDALLCVFKDSIRYEALVFDRIEVLNDVVSDNMYDNAIATIEWLIKEGYFNKDYLEERIDGNNKGTM